MAQTYYELTGTGTSDDGTSEVILAKDDDGNVTKSIGVGKPAQLSEKDQETLKRLGVSFEKVSKTEAEEKLEEAASGGAGSDAAVSGPVIADTSGKSNQQQ